MTPVKSYLTKEHLQEFFFNDDLCVLWYTAQWIINSIKVFIKLSEKDKKFKLFVIV